MNKLIVTFLILFCFGCQIFNGNRAKSPTDTPSSIIHANLILEGGDFGAKKIKTKIEILKDTLMLSAQTSFGLEFGNIVLTENMIYITQTLNNKLDSVLMSDFDPKFKLKNLKKSIFQLKNKKDTTHYTIDYVNCAFTDYIHKENIFLPQKIIYWDTRILPEKSSKRSVNIEYKFVNFSNKNKK